MKAKQAATLPGAKKDKDKKVLKNIMSYLCL